MTKKTTKKTTTKATTKTPKARPLHDVRFPGESPRYRRARDELLRAEVALRAQTEAVAARRRKLPLGGEVPEDYTFVGLDDRPVRMSELFRPDGETLVLYSFMFGPRMERPCPMCTSFLDGLDRQVRHVSQLVDLAVVARSPIARIRDFARERGWSGLRLLSDADNGYHPTYGGETASGAQLPAMNVFVRRGGRVHHFYNTELLYAPEPKGQNSRHIDLMWPLWNVLDLTPGGRGDDWYPSLEYGPSLDS
jgi:predicted dithiol-disulfide oxidoreductase (DUF899 family)